MALRDVVGIMSCNTVLVTVTDVSSTSGQWRRDRMSAHSEEGAEILPPLHSASVPQAASAPILTAS